MAAFLLFALTIAGCGPSTDNPTTSSASARSAFMELEGQLAKGDPAACESMTSEFKNKLAASVKRFSSDCPVVVKEVGEGFRADPDLRTKSIDKVKVRGNKATLVAHSTYIGGDVRTRVDLKRRSAKAGWMVAGDEQLDDVAPGAPLTAYRSYARAFLEGDGTKVCALSTSRGKDLMAKTLPESHSGGSCEGAVPFLAVAPSKLPRADVVGGEVEGSSATLYTLQSNGSGGWAFGEVAMEREGGKWLFDESRSLGVAPSRKTPGGPVA